MKISYEFVTGEISEIEVDEHLGGMLLDFDRQQYNNDHKETRRHVSLDGMDYEGELFASTDDTEGEAEHREDERRTGPKEPVPDNCVLHIHTSLNSYFTNSYFMFKIRKYH